MKIVSTKTWKRDTKVGTERAGIDGVAASLNTEAPGVITIGKNREGIDLLRRALDGAGPEEITRALDEVQADDVIATYTMSTDVVDRPGDRIHQTGWELDEYRTNPVLLFGHDSSKPPIGKALAVFVQRGSLRGSFKFTPESVNPFGAMIGRMVRGDFLRASSVGFLPIEYRVAEDRMTEDTPPWAPPIDFVRQKLLEHSAVPIPANPEALVDASSTRGLAESDVTMLREWAERMLAGDGGRVLRLDKSIVESIARAGTGRRVFVSITNKEDDAEISVEATCPECGYSGDIAEFTEPSSADDDKAADALSTAALVRALRRRGAGGVAREDAPSEPTTPAPEASFAPAPAVDPAASGAVETRDNGLTRWHPDFATPQEFQKWLGDRVKTETEAAMMKRSGRLPD